MGATKQKMRRQPTRKKSNVDLDDDGQGSSICGIAQVSVMLEQLYVSLPGGVPLYKSPLGLVLYLIEAEAADDKRRVGSMGRSPSPGPGPKARSPSPAPRSARSSKAAKWEEAA